MNVEGSSSVPPIATVTTKDARVVSDWSQRSDRVADLTADGNVVQEVLSVALLDTVDLDSRVSQPDIVASEDSRPSTTIQSILDVAPEATRSTLATPSLLDPTVATRPTSDMALEVAKLSEEAPVATQSTLNVAPKPVRPTEATPIVTQPTRDVVAEAAKLTEVALALVVSNEHQGGSNQVGEDDPQPLIRRPLSQLARHPKVVQEVSGEPADTSDQVRVFEAQVYKWEWRKAAQDAGDRECPTR